MCLGSLFWYCLLCICSILELEPIGLHWVHDSQKTGRIHHRTPVARAHELSIDKSSTRNGKTNRNLSQVGRFLFIMNILWSIASSPAWSNPAEFFYHSSCLDRCRQPLSSTKIPGNRHNNCNQHHKWQLQMAINHPQRGRWFIAPLGFSQSGPAVRGTSVMPPWMSNVKSEKSKVSARNFTFSAPESPIFLGEDHGKNGGFHDISMGISWVILAGLRWHFDPAKSRLSGKYSANPRPMASSCWEASHPVRKHLWSIPASLELTQVTSAVFPQPVSPMRITGRPYFKRCWMLMSLIKLSTLGYEYRQQPPSDKDIRCDQTQMVTFMAKKNAAPMLCFSTTQGWEDAITAQQSKPPNQWW